MVDTSFLAGEEVCLSLRWDAWPDAALDLYLVDEDDNVLAASETSQLDARGEPSRTRAG